MKLLSVDWDFFFEDPEHDPEFLYDWGHRETPLFINPEIWVIRESAFLRRGKPRPHVAPTWKTFWKRFNIAPDALLFFGESHSWAASQHVARGVTEVWNFDAHHDCGYRDTDIRTAFQTSSYDCGSWLIHYWAVEGASIHVRYPQWRSLDREVRPQIPGVDIKHARKTEPMPTFDRVFVCRSGAWVPPWCDNDHMQFLAKCPVLENNRIDMGDTAWPSTPRSYDDTAAARMVEETPRVLTPPQ